MRPASLTILFLALLSFGSQTVAAQPLPVVAAPVVTSLQADAGGYVRLEWQADRGASYQLCHAADWAMSVFAFCDDIGAVSSWVVRAPGEDGAIWHLSLRACSAEACSEPVRAAAVGRVKRDGYDLTASVLYLGDDRIRLFATARDAPLNLRFYRGAWGNGELYESACPDVGPGVPCVSSDLTLRGALVGIAAWRAGAQEAGVTLQVRPSPGIALMFDDGTGVVSNGRYLMQSVLDEYGVKGSFFLTGRAMQTYPTAVRALVSAGHRVGNHTYSHPYLTRFTDAQIGAELDQTEAIYRSLVPGGTLKPCFRAPNGDFNNRVLAVVAARGYRQYSQSISSMDYAGVAAATMVRTVVNEARDGGTVSFHTQELPTVAALRQIIPRLQAEGFHFVTVC